MCVCMYVCIHARMRVCMYNMCVHVYVYVYVYVFVHVHVCKCVCARISHMYDISKLTQQQSDRQTDQQTIKHK